MKAPYDILTENVFTDYFNTAEDKELIKCENFEFDMELFGRTINSEWNLVCDRRSIGSFVEMCFLAGAALGSVLSGWVSDRFGRKHTLMCFATLQVICGK